MQVLKEGRKEGRYDAIDADLASARTIQGARAEQEQGMDGDIHSTI